jgi:ATP-binding cassette, subfamily C, bacteriocin exporter
MWKKYICIIAPEGRQCGPAALATVAGHYGLDLSVAHLAELMDTDLQGNTLSDILNAAQLLGFEGSCGQVKYGLLDSIPLPAIVHLSRPPYGHFVTVHRVLKSRVTVADPALGLRTMSRANFENEWTGRAIILSPTSSFIPSRDYSAFLSLANILNHERRLVGLVVTLALLITSSAFAIAYFSGIAIANASHPMEMSHVLRVAAFVAVVGTCTKLCLTLARQHLLSALSIRLETRLADRFCEALLKMPFRYFQRHSLPDIISRIGDTTVIRNTIANTILTVFLDLVLLCASAPILITYNHTLALALLSLLPIIFLVGGYANGPLSTQERIIREATSRHVSAFISLVENIRTVKIFMAESIMRSQLNANYLVVQRAKALRAFISSSSTAIVSFISTSVMIGLLLGGLRMIGNHTTDAAHLLIFYTLATLFISSAERITPLFGSLSESLFSIARLEDVKYSQEEHSGSLEAPDGIYSDGIEIKNLSFQWRPGQAVLRSVSLDLRGGISVAIVGETGSGKTTLASILTGLYSPTSGEVLLKGIDAKKFSSPSLRSQIAVVFQDTDLIEGTIRQNIAIGREGADDDAIQRVAKLALADDFIVQKPKGYNYDVGAGGLALSGGQRQRLAIARALLKDASFMLLDEATSSLDAVTERQILDNIFRERFGKTTVIITHRLSAAARADMVAVLSNGAIVQYGSHEALRRVDGMYRRLWTSFTGPEGDGAKQAMQLIGDGHA